MAPCPASHWPMHAAVSSAGGGTTTACSMAQVMAIMQARSLGAQQPQRLRSPGRKCASQETAASRGHRRKASRGRRGLRAPPLSGSLASDRSCGHGKRATNTDRHLSVLAHPAAAARADAAAPTKGGAPDDDLPVERPARRDRLPVGKNHPRRARSTRRRQPLEGLSRPHSRPRGRVTSLHGTGGAPLDRTTPVLDARRPRLRIKR